MKPEPNFGSGFSCAFGSSKYNPEAREEFAWFWFVTANHNPTREFGSCTNTSPTRKRADISLDFLLPRLRVGLVLERFAFSIFTCFIN